MTTEKWAQLVDNLPRRTVTSCGDFTRWSFDDGTIVAPAGNFIKGTVMIGWQPIKTVPKDGTHVLLYWPNYGYTFDIDDGPAILIGFWKENGRLVRLRKEDILEAGISGPSYWSDNCEMDDTGLAQPKHSPTHWMPLPDPPASVAD